MVNLRGYRELIPWTQADLAAATKAQGSPVSLSTVYKAETGEAITRIKAQALIDVLGAELLRQGKIERRLSLADIEELSLAS